VAFHFGQPQRRFVRQSRHKPISFFLYSGYGATKPGTVLNCSGVLVLYYTEMVCAVETAVDQPREVDDADERGARFIQGIALGGDSGGWLGK
jgi:hypothetical protein